MKKYINVISCFLCGILFSHKLVSQQQNLSALYGFDLMQVNISGIGKNYFSSNLNYRAQWVQVKDAPRTYQLNTSLSLGKNQALALKVYNNTTGLLAFRNITGGYVYKLKLNDENNVYLGIGASYMQVSFMASRAIVHQPDDVNLQGDGDTFRANNFDSETGATWYGKNITAGFSVNHLYTTQGKLGNGTFTMRQDMNIHVCYLIKIKDALELSPILLTRYLVGNKIPTPELMLNTRFKKLFLAGVGYRYPNATRVSLGCELKGLRAIYCFDYNFAQVSKYFGTSHQVLLGFYINEKKKAATAAE